MNDKVICAECGGEMQICYGQYGAFYKCNKCGESFNVPEKDKICPKCGGYLKKRKNSITKKEFFACINYPNCNYTENIKK